MRFCGTRARVTNALEREARSLLTLEQQQTFPGEPGHRSGRERNGSAATETG